MVIKLEWVDKDKYLKNITIHNLDVKSNENMNEVLGVEESLDKSKVLIRRAICSKKVIKDYNVLNYS